MIDNIGAEEFSLTCDKCGSNKVRLSVGRYEGRTDIFFTLTIKCLDCGINFKEEWR